MLLRKILTTTLFVVFSSTLLTACTGEVSSSSGNSDGNCRIPSDRAADGSRCGDRAASVRPGGD